MHTLTSCLFLPSYTPLLSPENRRILLQSYLLTVFQILLVRGRPHIFPEEAMSYPLQPTGGARFAKEGKLEALGEPTSAEQQNPWLEIISNALVFRGKHHIPWPR